jgi:D-alanyl-D-alanine carboxypeptidase
MKNLTKKIFYIILIFICGTLYFSNKALAVDLEPFEINSESAILIEPESGNVLYSKNSTEKMYPASTTKIMTAILAIENCNLDEIATVSENAIKLVPSGYTNAKLVSGEKMSIEDLLYGLMLNSANEAANVIAEHVSGSIENFAKLMNQKAEELGCKNTHFVNANGMHDDNHYTTAEDLSIIATYCMENSTFRKIVSTVKYTLPATEQYPNTDRIMTNTNMLITLSSKYYYEYAIGVKTGYTSQAGNCLVSCAEKDNVRLICVTLKAGTATSNSSYRFADSKELLEYGFENFSNQTIIQKDTVIDTVQVLNATEESKNVNVVTQEDVSDFIKNTDISALTPEVQIQSNIEAPLYANDIVGTITYTIDGIDYSTNLVAETTAYTRFNYTPYIIAFRNNITYIFTITI